RPVRLTAGGDRSREGPGRDDTCCAGAIPQSTTPRVKYRLNGFSRGCVGGGGRGGGCLSGVGSEAGALEALGRGGAVHRVQVADHLAVVGLVPGLLARADEVDVQRGLLVA